LGTLPRAGENDRVSWVRFSSSRLSLVAGMGSGVGDPRSGRKMVLKPLPWNVPVKAVSGPRLGLGTGETLSLNSVRFDTSPNLNPLGSEKAGVRLTSLIVLPPIGLMRSTRLSPWRNCWREASPIEPDRDVSGQTRSLKRSWQ